MQPHRRQPTRLLRPWDSSGKNIEVGCHFLLEGMKVKSESEVAQSCPTLHDPMACSHHVPPSMGFSRQEYWSGLPLPSPRGCLNSSTESVMPSNHLILYCPLFLLPSIFPSIRVFSNESTLCLRWPKYWSFSISPSNEYSELISFRIDWFDLLAVQWSPLPI